ncbi:Hypothetical protein CAP_5897 [Chondromyces apiculatus DSM 436]|uniref:Uncharacterized protein n=1 Tax=Chondromyces apiculatus DSM 436 TaxID=1192034 RepID=A0A017TGU8_9BACT|nr:Hypothetical protein CAP_5897 [Chondromyces apiculatus DSM 436]
MRRASAFTRRAVATTLLVVVYVLLLPWFALALRLRRQPPRGWRVRRDPDLTTLPRLRAPF